MTTTDLSLYTATARASAAVVIARYSTSFGWASRLLDSSRRAHIANIYALVRVADELVDGPATAAGVSTAAQRELLADLERETERAIRQGYSTNLIVHAFATTAREHGIGAELCRPFFASMRRDLDGAGYDKDGLDAYIYGSAEVVGLMCLAVFEAGATRTDAERERLRAGAQRLGAAFQKVNFLRDFAGDHDELGRTYLAGASAALTPDAQARVIADIRADLRAADAALPLLGAGCRPAVWAARAMFGALADRLEAASVAELMRSRVRVPNVVKARILARALAMKAAR
ncbi:Phytoene/squalene synthetase [Paramicrobacterium humi]|uniref:Phytoene/squalene synthetase n=1 Tax=Paramicrobacterium humi TaxID=640635 RepID=A0A1H4NA82_9MICO|nr:squalene/phytoene synthase family protein [Microbacterium humi]SEB91462.1 Phytoene/squalene synthetase [Microbacterium humi]